MKKPIAPRLGASLALIACSLTFVACGSSNPEEDGYAAMQAGDHAKAITLLGEALESAEPGSPKAHQLAVARCQSLAHQDATACKETFLNLSQEGTKLTRKDYEDVATELMGVKAYKPAAHVVAAGIDKFSDSKRLPEYLAKLLSLAKSGDAPGLGDALAGLGYAGD